MLRYKGQFTDEFTREICGHLEKLRQQKRLVLVDCGGKIDDKNEAIWGLCTHALIVCANPDDFSEWRTATGKSNLDLLCEVESSLQNRREVLSTEPLRVVVGPLERGEQPEVPGDLLDRLVSLMQQ